MRPPRLVLTVSAVVLLGGPTVLAFFSGGYFAAARLPAAIVAWVLVLVLTATGPAPLPRSLPGWLALGGLVALTAWTAVSLAWAPVGGAAIDAVGRLVLYTGALIAALGVLRFPPLRRAVEPALAAGATVVIGYGLVGRLLPGIVTLDRSTSAGGRLEQPITYWNAEGALAAVGLILCARLAGDPRRPAWMRAAAAAAAAPLSAGAYLSYSRGALAVAVLGLVVLVAAAPTRAQLRASASLLGIGVAASAAVAMLPGVAALEGDQMQRDGAIGLVLLILLASAAAFAAPGGGDGRLRSARRLWPVTAVGLVLVVGGLIAGGLAERPSAAELAAGASASRLTNASSNRYEYWRVGAEAFARDPLTGVGAGGFRVEWLRERQFPEAVRDTHSLEVEIAAELGVVGLLAFAVLLAGVILSAGRALRDDAAAAAGGSVALLAWFLHASIDWDWQLPAVALPAVILAAALVAAGEALSPPAR